MDSGRTNEQYKCSFCFKSYMRKCNLDKHRVFCEFNSNKTKFRYEGGMGGHEFQPSVADLYSIVIDLSLKYDKLQSEYDTLSRWVQQKKRKINIIEWLNEKAKPSLSYEEWYEQIQLSRKHLEYIFAYDFVDGIIFILQELLPVDISGKNSQNVIQAFDHKEGVFYIYGVADDECGWCVMDGEIFQKLIRGLSLKLMGQFKEWQDENMHKFEDENFARAYSLNLKKVMGNTDYNTQYNKIRNKLYKHIKVKIS